jgi:hypothetical protein
MVARFAGAVHDAAKELETKLEARPVA